MSALTHDMKPVCNLWFPPHVFNLRFPCTEPTRGPRQIVTHDLWANTPQKRGRSKSEGRGQILTVRIVSNCVQTKICWFSLFFRSPLASMCFTTRCHIIASRLSIAFCVWESTLFELERKRGKQCVWTDGGRAEAGDRNNLAWMKSDLLHCFDL